MLVQDCYALISLGLWIRTLGNTRPTHTKSWAINSIQTLENQLEENNLIVSIAYTKASHYVELKNNLSKIEQDDHQIGAALATKICELILTLEQVVFAESTTKKIYILPERRFNTEYLLNTPHKLIKNGVFNKLDEIAKHDITSACKCLLFGQATAAAFHILRATESVLKSYYFHQRKQNRLKKPMWADMLGQLQAKTTKKPPAALLKTLDIIRTSYRNPTQHPEAIYEIDNVQDLFGVCFDVIGQMGSEL